MQPMDPRERLVALDGKLGRAWAKLEILLGLAGVAVGQFLLMEAAVHSIEKEFPWTVLGSGTSLFALGGYLAMAGHRSHLYRWNNRNTVVLIDEIRRLHDKGQQ
jgi:hypothetical protein